MAKFYDYFFKVVLVGDSSVGKTCILVRLADNNFNPVFTSTIGIDFKIKTFDVDGKKIKLSVWDTAGQERFRTITTSYYRGANGIMLVYDLTNENTFESIRNWIKTIKERAPAEVEKMILGNKSDLEDSRMVSKERGCMLAAEYGIKFSEISAKSGLNIEKAFLALTQDMKEKMDKAESPKPRHEAVRIPDKKEEKEAKEGCCK